MDVRSHTQIEVELTRLGERLASTHDAEEHRRLVSDIHANRKLLGGILLERDKKLRPEVYGLAMSHDEAEDRAVAMPSVLKPFGKRVTAELARLAEEPVNIEALEADIDALARRLGRTNDAGEHDRIVRELAAKRKKLGGLLLARDKRSRPAMYRNRSARR
ncbi:hypothetical protein [Rhizobium sp. BK176]|uniref:hypothetical protein n=1 Tax=Rhizobium sp. BK176 TaxID=2587071 RepID=UPI002168CB7D|nr:hypothetical protein [Rhizobium sp. BK176]MCS4090210.1 hypothetical protein [Rhizobium sp. BK176]